MPGPVGEGREQRLREGVEGVDVRVLLVVNYAREGAVEGAHELERWLLAEGADVTWAPDKKLFPNAHVDVDGVSLVVALGGDGTLLRAARIVGYSEVPVVGVSYGHLGFLTCDGPENLLRTVADALAGELHASRRATLDIDVELEHEDGTTTHERRFALNDFALAHGAGGDMIEFDVSVSGNHVTHLRGDGFVVATATGSTGYALAAGGPIVTPGFDGMVCVPVAPHTILARAFLTSAADVVRIQIWRDRLADRLFMADGQPVGLPTEAVAATVKRGPGDVILLDRSAESFYGSVSRVFYGNDGNEQPEGVRP